MPGLSERFACQEVVIPVFLSLRAVTLPSRASFVFSPGLRTSNERVSPWHLLPQFHLGTRLHLRRSTCTVQRRGSWGHEGCHLETRPPSAASSQGVHQPHGANVAQPRPQPQPWVPEHLAGRTEPLRLHEACEVASHLPAVLPGSGAAGQRPCVQGQCSVDPTQARCTASFAGLSRLVSRTP